MSNLLQETIAALNENQITEADVIWVGSSSGEFAVTWDEFVKIANVEYSSGFGGQAVASDLVIVGKDFWFERGEYDGSEWWEYKSVPVISASPKSFTSVNSGDSWASIQEMNRPGGKYGEDV